MEFAIGTFNVCGLTQEEKQENLAKDTESYKLDNVAYKKQKLKKVLIGVLAKRNIDLQRFSHSANIMATGLL